MSTSRMRDNVERWLIHESLPFNNIKNEENSFQVLVKHAGPYGIPVDSDMGKKVSKADIGIVFHTHYSGDDLATMQELVLMSHQIYKGV